MSPSLSKVPDQYMRIPILDSSRLLLRPYQPTDFEAFASLNANEKVRRHVGGPLTRAESAWRFERFVTGVCLAGNEAWAIQHRNTGEYVGHAWFVMREGADCPEMGFLLEPRFWRQGYGTEVARTLVRYALMQAGYARIVTTVDADHTASIKVLERAGMKREGEQQDAEGVFLMYSKKC